MTFEDGNSKEYSNLPGDQKMLARLREAAEVIAFMDAKVVSPGEEPAWMTAFERSEQENISESASEERVARFVKRASRKSNAASTTVEKSESVSVAGGMTGKRAASKYKIDRRMGENIWGSPKSPVNRREYGPGEHGQRRKGKLSDFGIQLRAKQKLKGYYGDLTEKQFRRIFSDAQNVAGDTGENLIVLLERRLDAVVFRAKFAPTVFVARQLVNHGHVTVNGKRVNIPSFRVSQGDTVEVSGEAKKLDVVINATRSTERDVPEYIVADSLKLTATLARLPSLADVPFPVQMEPSLVVEFYKNH